MGAIFCVALARVKRIEDLPGPTVALLADPDPSHPPLRELDLGPATLLVGAERDGLPAEMVTAADHTARIPIATHSLNAAMAATVALYEVTRMARA